MKKLVVDSTNNKTWLSGVSYWAIKRGLQLDTQVYFLADRDHYKKTWDEWRSPKDDNKALNSSGIESDEESPVEQQCNFSENQTTDTIWPEKNDVLSLRTKFPTFYPGE